MRGKAGAVGCIVLLSTGVLPLPAAGSTFGDLDVAAWDWRFVSLPYNLTYGRPTFQTPGDLNGDGFDDLVAWRGNNNSAYGAVVFNGSSNGLDLQHWRVANGGVIGTVTDTGAPSALDARPSGVDFNGDGYDDMASYQAAGMGCPETPVSGGTGGTFCTAAIITRPIVAFGDSDRVFHEAGELSGAPEAGYPPGPYLLYLVGATSDGARAGLLTSEVVPRSADGTKPAVTRFALYTEDPATQGWQTHKWNLSEPTPLTTTPRPSSFVGATDFDGDGYVDIVAWAPPGSTTRDPVPGQVSIFMGSADGPVTDAPVQIAMDGPGPLIADFDGDGHPDLASYQVFSGDSSHVPPVVHIDVNFYLWTEGQGPFPRVDFLHLEGPSIFQSQPPPRVQAGDVDGDGRADLVVAKYDTTSASAGHILVDTFLNLSICRECDKDTFASPSDSSEIQLWGTDIYTNEGGLRVNLQSDFDGDGLRDTVVGFSGANAQRAPTHQSGFVAVHLGWQVVREAYGVSIDADPGHVVYPTYRNYTIGVTREAFPGGGIYRVDFPGPNGAPFLEINRTTGNVTSSDPSMIESTGPSYVVAFDCLGPPCPEIMSIGVRFNWSFPADQPFGIELRTDETAASALTPFARLPRAATFHAATNITGNLSAESEGRGLASGDWVRGGVLVNFTANLSVEFQGSNGIYPVEPVVWRLAGLSNATLVTGDLNTSLFAPNATNRDWVGGAGFTGLPAQAGQPLYPLQLRVDADLPQFGDHLPLETDWATSHPVYVAAQIFDNESGVDPARIEYTWQNDIAPFLRWSAAEWMPGQSAAEVVAHASIYFPEGNLSNIIWRVWDRAGNGPIESPIWGVKVDTQDVAFHDPSPDALSWQTATPAGISVSITAGTSGLNRSSVEFRLSNTGPFGFGPWRRDCGYPPELDPPGVVAGCAAMIGPGGYRPFHYANLTEGDQNWVQWRAASNASSALKNSDPFQIRFDSKAPVLSLDSPSDAHILPNGPLPLQIEAHEGSPASVAQSGLNTSSGAATFRIRAPGAADFGAPVALVVSNLSADHWSATFSGTLNLEPGNSTLQVNISDAAGHLNLSLYTLRVNQPPSLSVTSDPPNLTVLANGTITLTAVVVDPDSSSFTYRWAADYPFLGCFRGSVLPIPPVPLSRRPTATLSPRSPECLRTNTTGDLFILLTVTDERGGSTTIRFAVHIVATLPAEAPPPGSSANGSTTILPSVNFALGILLLLAAIGAVSFVVYQRRLRRPPDNL